MPPSLPRFPNGARHRSDQGRERAARHAINEIVFQVLKFATGQNFDREERPWRNWLAQSQGLPPDEEIVPERKPTFIQLVKAYGIVMPGNNTALAMISRPYETQPFT